MTDTDAPSLAPSLPSAQPEKASLLRLFSRAGAPSIADLGFDAQPDPMADGKLPVDSDSGEQIGFPGERVPHISYGFEGERWRIRNAAWLIGQSATGLILLDRTYRAGLRICFDAMISTGETIQSYVHVQDKIVTLDNRATLEQSVLHLAYNLALACSMIDGVFYDNTFSPPAALLAHRMATANAHAILLQVCFELQTATSIPDEKSRKTFWHMASKNAPRLASAYAQLALNELSMTQGSAMAGAIREFYSHAGLREKADCEVINYFRALPAAQFKDAKSMTGSFDPVAQSYKLTFPGFTYAMAHDPKLNLLSLENVASSAAVAEAVQSLQTTRRNAGVKDRETWHIQTV